MVLYKVKTRRGKSTFHIADPGKGLTSYTQKEFEQGWISTLSNGQEKGITMLFCLTPKFGSYRREASDNPHTLAFVLKYISIYKKYFGQIALGLVMGCGIQFALPFMTQATVDLGITNKDIGIIWLILAGQLLLILGNTAFDFIRRWLLLYIGVNTNILMVSDFLGKLLKLPMPFFDTRKTGDILQRMDDHRRIQGFLTDQVLSILFSVISFVVFSVVLALYDIKIFIVLLAANTMYAAWTLSFMKRRKVIDYDFFEKQATSQDKTLQIISYMQEIKLQNCPQRRRKEWENTQADLFEVQMKSLKLQQIQESRQHAYKQPAQCGDNGYGGNGRDRRAYNVRHDAVDTVYNRADCSADTADNVFRILAAGCENQP